MDNQNGSYGSGGWKKWLWVYIVAAIVIYGAVYLVYKNKHAASSASNSTSTGIYGQ